MNNVNPTEELINQELAIKRAKAEAAARDTAGVNKFINITRGISWCGAVIPFIGIFAIAIGGFVAFWASLYMVMKGNGPGGLKQLFVTIVGGGAATIVWLIVNFTIVAVFG